MILSFQLLPQQVVAVEDILCKLALMEAQAVELVSAVEAEQTVELAQQTKAIAVETFLPYPTTFILVLVVAVQVLLVKIWAT
jgi:hypothetical protein